MTDPKPEPTSKKPSPQDVLPMGMGIALCAALGAALGNVAIGIAVGIALGGVGVAINRRKAEK